MSDLRGGNKIILSESSILPDPSMLYVAELFAGIGGFRIGLSDQHFSIIYAQDSDYHTKTTYDANFNTPSLTCIDISAVLPAGLPHIDIITAGIESLTPQHLPHIIRIIRATQPTWIIIEAVKNITKQPIYEDFLQQVKLAKYSIVQSAIDVSKVTSMPQSRERTYIVACNDIIKLGRFTFPITSTAPVQTISSLLENPATIHDKYYYQPEKAMYTTLNDAIKKENTIYQFRRYYVRENKTDRCPTLTANMGKGGHNVPILKDTAGIRKLIPKECLTLQGFPSTYKIPPRIADCHVYAQVGGASHAMIANKLGRQILIAENIRL